MQYVTHNQDNQIDINGSCLQGSVDCDYKTLVKLFGKPGKVDKYKVDAKWDIKFQDGTIATIYNYKDGKNYCGNEGTPKTKIRDWHIGGFSNKAVELILITIAESV